MHRKICVDTNILTENVLTLRIVKKVDVLQLIVNLFTLGDNDDNRRTSALM